MKLNATALAVSLALLVPTAILPHSALAQTDTNTNPTGTAQKINFTINAGSLEQGLIEFSTQTGITVSFTPQIVKGLQTNGITGNYTSNTALNRLLAGSGLQARSSGNGTYSIIKSTIQTLPAVTVNADYEDTSSSPLNFLDKKAESGALGTKRVLDTPFSIALVSDNDIIERGAKSIGQIFFNDASVYTPTPSFNTDWWGTQIRGLGVRNHYIDDVPLMLNWGGDFPTEVIDNVSALKGLTGFMYGFGTPGGALSYQLKRPSETPETSVTFGYRNPSLFSAHVDTSHNLGGDFALRANIATEQGTAYNASEIDRTVASLSLDKQFGSSLLWQTTLVYEDNKNTAEPFQFYLSMYDAVGSDGRMPEATYDYDDINVDNAYYASQTLLAITGLGWRINEQWVLNYQLGFSRKDHESNKAFVNILNAEGDYSGAIYNFAGQLDTVFTQAMLQGTVETLGMTHEIVGGLGYQRAQKQYSNFDYRSDEFIGNIYTLQTYRVEHTPDFSLNSARPEIVQQNAFLSDTIHFSEQWQAIAGLRFTDYNDKSGYKTREVSPTLALIYKPDEQTSIYSSYVEGLEPGSTVADRYTNAGEILDATVSTQIELGAKHQLNALEFTAAIFKIERANQIDEISGADLYRTQDGLVVYQGAEVSTAYQFNDDLNLGLSATYLDANIDKVSNSNAHLEGNTPASAPKWQVVANAQYNIHAIPGLSIHGAARYFGEAYTDDNNLLAVPSRTIVNAGASYNFEFLNKDLNLHVNINNLLNEKYWGTGSGSANIGESRNLTLSLEAQL